MRMLFEFLVKIPKKTEDTINVGGKELFLDTRFNEFENRVSYGEIVSLPAKFDTPAEVGDILVFHHHVNMEDKYHLEDDIYMVTYDPTARTCHAFACIKPNGEMRSLADWVFLTAPVKEKKEETSASGLFLGIAKEDTTNTEGPIHVSDGAAAELGLVQGTVVGFKPNADYRITLPDGTDVFRMHKDDVWYERTV